MLNEGNIKRNIQEILDSELSVTEMQIKESMAKNKQVVTGRTRDSLYHKVEATSGYIASSADHIDTLEKGISPERSRLDSLGNLYRKIHAWKGAKGFGWKSSQSFSIARKQQLVGSVLFRAGGNRNVYSDKADPLVKRISERIGDYFVNVKILE